ncbi:hypothetical protein AMIS_21000 [Actinoplanes missouriensis 431]|uniref:Uncharacterized protein n=2 Tax=Actinoplanes missouriensis TaxID=1866 RepID=I0H2T3_ACTM4|nr:hypothetical protein AMIS_21000 [Actinoplanes missouriensis 431]
MIHPARYLNQRPEWITRMNDTVTSADTPTAGFCHSLARCPGWNPATRLAAETSDPFCTACLDRAHRDIRGLVYDYVDLAQLHEASLSQAPSEHTSGGGHESPMLLAGHVEALQAEIVHAATTWEGELRAAHALNHGMLLPQPAWATTRSHPLPQPRLRGGAALQRAINLIAPRLRHLSRLAATVVHPAGIEDEPADRYGWEAVQHLQRLHSRARATLGRTTRTFYVPGECWACDARPVRDLPGPLWRSEPTHDGDPMDVHCEACGAVRPYADYEHYQQHLMWPGQDSDQLVQVAA